MGVAGTNPPIELADARKGRRGPSLMPVPRGDIRPGVPVPYAIFDANGRLLLSAGEQVESEYALDILRQRGLYFDKSGSALVNVPEPASAPVARPGPAPSAGVGKPFATLRLLPGTVIHLDFPSEATDRPRIALRLIGHLEGGGVLLSSVNDRGAVVPFREGEVVLAKVVAGNDLGLFNTTVQKVCFAPFPYIHLAYPDAVYMKVLRRHARVETRLIVAIAREGVEAHGPLAGLAINLSASGLRLEAAKGLFDRGTRLRLGLRLPAVGEERTLSIPAQVRSLSTSGAPSGSVHYGLEFDELPANDRLVLEHFVFQGLLEA
ncbi:MAG: flagellar brake protein [Pseudomonadota bacterium]|jgi:c-di-GMP-binding flagellar brake protein YcgR